MASPNYTMMNITGHLMRIVRIGYFRLSLEIPPLSHKRLERLVASRCPVFLVPNHPESLTDWTIDKEISMRYFPKMAAWGASKIVNRLPWLFSKNNVLPNNGKEVAKLHAISCALKGHGVLLHPEGKSTWNRDVIGELFPGAAKMAITAVQLGQQYGQYPAYIVPIIWKYNNDTGDPEYYQRMTRKLIEGGRLNRSGLIFARPPGPRVARICVPEPIVVTGNECPLELTRQLRELMQATLNDIKTILNGN